MSGRDFFVVLGRDEPWDPRWGIARDFGFLNAGHGSWHWKRLGNLEPGDRVFAYVAGEGYVGVGRVTGEMIPARDAEVRVGGRRRRLLDEIDATDAWRRRAASADPEQTEMVVPVEWLAARPAGSAYWEKGKGLFSNRSTACELRDAYTVAAVEEEFGLR